MLIRTNERLAGATAKSGWSWRRFLNCRIRRGCSKKSLQLANRNGSRNRVERSNPAHGERFLKIRARRKNDGVPKCNGSGTVPCAACNGTGQETTLIVLVLHQPCPVCGGKKKITCPNRQF